MSVISILAKFSRIESAVLMVNLNFLPQRWPPPHPYSLAYIANSLNNRTLIAHEPQRAHWLTQYSTHMNTCKDFFIMWIFSCSVPEAFVIVWTLFFLSDLQLEALICTELSNPVKFFIFFFSYADRFESKLQYVFNNTGTACWPGILVFLGRVCRKWQQLSEGFSSQLLFYF